ncbi:MAG: ATP-binding cassette domain-containing protein [Bacillota bacterium]|nr:ATP-binding cassette domain-containing protein [Bacillota bacterium]
MIKFENVSFGFPQKDLYEDISFSIEAGDHAALIGSNGCGKSSLIRLILDRDHYTYDGIIRIDPGCRIGCISQFVEHTSEEITSFDYLATPFLDLLARFDEICARLCEEENPDLQTQYDSLMAELDSLDAYNYEPTIRKMLSSAGLDNIADTPVTRISGGEYKLLCILRSMLMKPQLLIMDEPDVFLDFENLVSLTRMINRYDGTILAVTHSRLLLSQCFDKILDIENKGIREFPGTFAEYSTWILETKIGLFEHCRDFDEFIEKQEDIVKRVGELASAMAIPRLGRQVKARATYLERLKKMRGEDPFLEDHHHAFRFLTAAESALSDSDHGPEIEPAPVIALKDFSLSYDREILSHLSFSVQKGEKVALVGANGTGKSSLLREIYAMLEKEAPGKAGYFRQVITEQDGDLLSGGERCLAQLDRLCEEPHDILLLDEPTSHLDIHAQIALEKAIREYTGTVLMVSHDLFAVTGCTDRVLILENGTVREMSGRSYRKSVYRNYFDSDIFETERRRIAAEIRVSNLIRARKFDEARKELSESLSL